MQLGEMQHFNNTPLGEMQLSLTIYSNYYNIWRYLTLFEHCDPISILNSVIKILDSKCNSRFIIIIVNIIRVNNNDNNNSLLKIFYKH
ncbi:hypothetical protein H8356DRAFT_1328431 [Neocallimastix lanati (nom. inval.)]|nr:hypothetical protein H8356DRAFT_1328431 [Neocallimastix sp. JGI-2020a]